MNGSIAELAVSAKISNNSKTRLKNSLILNDALKIISKRLKWQF